MKDKQFLTSHEVAEMLGYTVEYVNWLCRQGKLKAKKPLGRWRIYSTAVVQLLGEDEKANGISNIDI